MESGWLFNLDQMISLLNGNGLDLDVDALWQLPRRDTGSRRLVREPLFVLAVHFAEVLHVGQKNLREG